ncbi:hypothetical protein HQ563_12925 [bacterium]|nr:hypothetical protein [bacterium]
MADSSAGDGVRRGKPSLRSDTSRTREYEGQRSTRWLATNTLKHETVPRAIALVRKLRVTKCVRLLKEQIV